MNFVFCFFHKMILTQFNIVIKVIRSGYEREYFMTEMIDFMDSNGILHQTTCSHSPEQNRVRGKMSTFLRFLDPQFPINR